MANTAFIEGSWREASGEAFESRNPAHGDVVWEGSAASAADAAEAVDAAARAFGIWGRTPYTQRMAIVERFGEQLEATKTQLAALISREVGKPRWEALIEVQAMVSKIQISARAYDERTGVRAGDGPAGATAALRHRPHGVMIVLGPFNFPGHLPNGHIVPALLAGNTVVFKPSEQAPAVAEFTAKLWARVGLPAGAFNLVQGGRDVAEALLDHPAAAGVLFTGSADAGVAIHRRFAGRPEVILALEMGGNNPLVVWDAVDFEAASILIVQSAFATAGQRCTCARRLVIPSGDEGDELLEQLNGLAERLIVGPFDGEEEPFCGPVISEQAAERALAEQARLIEAGATPIRQMERLDELGPAFLSPGVIDVTEVVDRSDDEIFAPLLQVVRATSFEAAIAEANGTRYGLAAGLISDSKELFDRFVLEARAGIVNWNRPLTGASSAAPFGGVGRSGNHRPSAYYAADYCAYPVAGLLSNALQAERLPQPKGLRAKWFAQP